MNPNDPWRPPPGAPDPYAPPVPVDAFRPQEVHVSAKSSGGRFQAQVIQHPRLAGLGCLALSAILGGVNYAIYAHDRTYYLQLVVLTPPIGMVGSWLTATGQPIDPATGKPRTWWRAGAAAALVIGVILGVVVCVGMS